MRKVGVVQSTMKCCRRLRAQSGCTDKSGKDGRYDGIMLPGLLR